MRKSSHIVVSLLSLLSIPAIAECTAPIISQSYVQKLQNIYTPENGIQEIKPGETLVKTFQLPVSYIPIKTTLRVAGNTLIPQPFTNRGEDYFRKCETILNDNLDPKITMSDSNSLYFKGDNDDFKRMVWNRIPLSKISNKNFIVSVPIPKCTKFCVMPEGSFGVELGIYFMKNGRHELDVFDSPDSTIFIPIPEGSYEKKYITQKVSLPEKAACILLSIGGSHFTGECWVEAPSFTSKKDTLWHMPFKARIVDNKGWAYKDVDYTKDEINYWVSVNMSERWWPYWKIEFNGKTIQDGKIFDRCSHIADFYVQLPAEAANGGTLSLTLVDEPHRKNYPYQLRHLDIISEPARDFEVICVPKYVSMGSEFGVLVETNIPDISLTTSADSCITPGFQTYILRKPGLHVLKFKALSTKSCAKITISDGTRTENCAIDQIICKGRDNVYLSVGDDIYIDKHYDEYSRYFKWYLSSRAGNWFQFRPSYQWSGVREIDTEVVKYFTDLLNDLQMPYAWQVEGRTFAGVNINPTKVQLESPMFMGKQAHENDGGYYYWHQFQYQGLQSDIAAKTRPYGGIFAKKRPEFTDHGAFVHYDPYCISDMAMGARYFVDNIRLSKGESSRHTGPSTMFRYFYQAGYDWCGAEQMYGPEDVIMSSLRGASRAYDRPIFGTLHAMQWNNGSLTTPDHPLVHYMSLAVAYMHGSSHINTEDALWTDEFLNDRYTEAGKAHMDGQNRILDFIQTHTRRGNFHTRIGTIQGRNDSWLCFQRWNAWSQEGDEWKFADAELSFDLLKIFYPNCNLGFCNKEHMFTHTPYGPIDIFPIEAPQDQLDSYGMIVFLGWNTYKKEDFEHLKTYVQRGGTLIMTAAHINSNLKHDGIPQFPDDDAPLRQLLGDDYRSMKGMNVIKYGYGQVYYFADPKYPVADEIRSEYERCIRNEASRIVAGETDKGWVDTGDAIDFTVWDEGSHRTIYLLNTDWKHRDTCTVCNFIYGRNNFSVDVKSGLIGTIHCKDGLALHPQSNTSDILDIARTKDGWTVTIQTTNSDTFDCFRKDGFPSEPIHITQAGIHILKIPAMAKNVKSAAKE